MAETDTNVEASDALSSSVNGRTRADIARAAFESGDVELSAMAHTLSPTEMHQRSGEFAKTIVFGGLDGIITTFAVVTSVHGANLSTGIILVLGIANLVADAFGMAFGEYIGEKSEHEWIAKERSREIWEFDNYKDGEMKEMIELYMQKGFSEQDARDILTIMGNHKEFFIDHMMVQELGILPEDDDGNGALKGAGVMFVSFIAFGIIPLFAYMVLNPFTWTNFNPTFLVACILTGVALFVLGAVKSKFESMRWWVSGIQVLFNGAIAAVAAYAVGVILKEIVNVSCV
eukprot:m.226237 g.226237  ORF g.226237 m.226237 type:complete len:288 (-) comp16900_c0_seq1:84-947(-)